MKKIKTYIVMFLGVLGLNACGLPGGTIPSDHYYRLPTVEVESVTTLPGTIVIKPVRVDGLYHERVMLYVDEHEPLELKRYHYHYWVETPASLVHKYLEARLKNDQSKLQTTNIELRPVLLNFERLVSNGKAEAYVRLNIHVKAIDDSTRLFAKKYEARVAAMSMSMHDTVEAFGAALDKIVEQLIRDLSI